MTDQRPTIRDCAFDATLLLGVMEAIGHLQNDGHTNALVAVIESAITDARNLADKLDDLESQRPRPVASEGETLRTLESQA